MSVSYLFEDDLLIFRAQGAVTVREFYAAWKAFTADEPFQPPIDALIDLRGAHVDVPGQEMEQIVYRLKHNQFFNKMVFVAERGSFTYAMGRMFCINAECAGCPSEIFLDMADAMVWLYGEGFDDSPPNDDPGRQ